MTLHRVLVVFLLIAPAALAAEPRQADAAWAIYHPDPSHIRNRVIRVLFEMSGPSGEDVPQMWPESLLQGKRYEAVIRTLDEFLRADPSRGFRDPAARVLFQHGLLEIFNWATMSPEKNRQARGTALQRRLVKIMRAVALEGEEINRLPGNYGRVVASRAYAADYDPTARQRPFLPPDLLDENGSWARLATADPRLPAAAAHMLRFGMNADFAVHLSFPGGQDGTRRVIEQHNAEISANKTVGRIGQDDAPPGTRVALVRRMLAVDKAGYVHVTNIVERVQMRVYRDPEVPPQHPQLHHNSVNQDFFVFRLDRKALARGEAVSLKPAGAGDFTLQGLDLILQDPRPSPSELVLPPSAKSAGFTRHGDEPILASCPQCHGGVMSLQNGTLLRADSAANRGRDASLWTDFYQGYLLALWRLP